jgi:hypothetical protein
MGENVISSNSPLAGICEICDLIGHNCGGGGRAGLPQSGRGCPPGRHSPSGPQAAPRCSGKFKYAAKRGLIYTEHKPICRLCKICNPFFYEFRVIPSASVLQLACYTATYAPKRL